jgi:hypothetical protein
METGEEPPDVAHAIAQELQEIRSLLPLKPLAPNFSLGPPLFDSDDDGDASDAEEGDARVHFARLLLRR